MLKTKLITLILLSLSVVLFLGDAPRSPLTILAPVFPDSLAFDQGQLFVVTGLKDEAHELMLSTQWEIEKVIDIGTKANKDNFAKEVYKLFPQKSTIEHVSSSYLFYNGWSKPDSLIFSYNDTMTVRSFWQLPQFAELVRQTQAINSSYVLIHMRGWKDTIYTSNHPDPSDTTHKLYRIPVQFIPGINKIYLAANTDKNDAVEFYANYVTKPRSIKTDEWQFHGSNLAASCAKCHKELPSETNADGERDKCGVCHNEIAGGLMKHGPAAEPKECSTCHERSVEKNIEIVPKGVPGVCLDCHTEKKEEVESAVVKHKVATDCVICHSPHATDQPKFLKNDVYRLCTGCHQSYSANHPVDKHPLRFAKLNKESAEEISCVSCHNPHGSANTALLKASGGSMAVCMQCHQK